MSVWEWVTRVVIHGEFLESVEEKEIIGSASGLMAYSRSSVDQISLSFFNLEGTCWRMSFETFAIATRPNSCAFFGWKAHSQLK